MTTPHERTRSVIHTRDFLIELSRDTSLPDRLRRDAEFLLRHYPAKSDMVLAGLMEQQTDSIAGLMGPVFGVLDSD
ncbi:BPSL0761 family protein [Pseudomonas amygdali]|uniref:BPSL0761 family protein n=1 Tax=Pseudomonas amygdali TaxID=47877 RepID=UPI0015D48B93|nr:BPSL0761 family protein [Pseudomonas amygdali]